MRKQIYLLLLATAIIVSLSVAFSIHNLTSAASEEDNVSLRPSAIAISSVNPHYLTSPPNFPNNTYKITKIFLENATLWYGYSNEKLDADIEFDVPIGMSFFMVNGTIRNDYTGSEIVALAKEGISSCTIGLDIILFDSAGNSLSSINRGNPFRGCFQVSLISGEQANFKVAYAVPENVASFKIFIRYLDPLPLF